MTLQERIQKDFQQSIADRNTPRTEFLKVVVAELSRKSTKEVSDEEVLKELKRMKEGAVACGNSHEVIMLDEYLPKMMTEEEIKVIVSNIIETHNFKTMKDLGAIMKILNSYGPTMDKAIASKLVKQFLNN